MTSLKRALNAYHTNKVEIKRSDQKQSRAIVETIKRDVYYFLQGIKVPVQPFEPIGSVFEGLKVITYDEFDLLMPIKFPNPVKVIPIRKAGQYYLSLKRYTSRRASGSRGEWCKDLSRYTDDRSNLSATLVRQAFQSFLQRWVSVSEVKHQSGIYSVSVATGGPAITIQLKKGGPKLSIDFVPAVEVTGDGQEDALFIAKPRKVGDLESDMGGDNSEEALWMISHCRSEKMILKNIDSHDNGCRKKCIKILKTIRQHREQLCSLSNYTFKMIILKLDGERAWSSKELANRFVDSIEELHNSLKIGYLPSHFNKSVNIFASMSPIAMANMEGYLRRIIRKRSYIKDLLICPEGCKTCYRLSIPRNIDYQENKDLMSGYRRSGVASCTQRMQLRTL